MELVDPIHIHPETGDVEVFSPPQAMYPDGPPDFAEFQRSGFRGIVKSICDANNLDNPTRDLVKDLIHSAAASRLDTMLRQYIHGSPSDHKALVEQVSRARLAVDILLGAVQLAGEFMTQNPGKVGRGDRHGHIGIRRTFEPKGPPDAPSDDGGDAGDDPTSGPGGPGGTGDGGWTPVPQGQDETARGAAVASLENPVAPARGGGRGRRSDAPGD